MNNAAIRLRAEPLRSLAYSSISGTYMGIGTAYLNPVRIYNLQNLTDAILLFSWDGINDHIVLPANGYIIIDISTNQTGSAGALSISQGDRTYVKTSGSPSLGSVYLSIYYASNS